MPACMCCGWRSSHGHIIWAKNLVHLNVEAVLRSIQKIIAISFSENVIGASTKEFKSQIESLVQSLD